MSSIESDFNQNFEDAIDVIQHHYDNSYYDSDFSYSETLRTVQQPSMQCHMSDPRCSRISHPSDVPTSTYVWSETTQPPWSTVLTDVPVSQSLPTESSNLYTILPPQNNKGRKKLRLYEYLHQALHDPNMCDSIQWTDSSSGTFHFISKNKEKLAECWGQRKGNRKTMTYQKMARALRNYSRTGEIIKVRRKLTYQFNPDILHRLGSTQVNVPLPRQQPPQEEHWQQQNNSDQSYDNFAEWQNWCGPYTLSEDYSLCSSYTLHSSIKS